MSSILIISKFRTGTYTYFQIFILFGFQFIGHFLAIKVTSKMHIHIHTYTHVLSAGRQCESWEPSNFRFDKVECNVRQ